MKYFKLLAWYERGGKNLKPEIEESNHWNTICGFGEVGVYLKQVLVIYIHIYEVI